MLIEQKNVREHAIQTETHTDTLLFWFQMDIRRFHLNSCSDDGLKKKRCFCIVPACDDICEVLAQFWKGRRCISEFCGMFVCDGEDSWVILDCVRDLAV